MAAEKMPATYKTGCWLNKDNRLVMVHTFMTPNCYRIFNYFLIRAIQEKRINNLVVPATELIHDAHIRRTNYSEVLLAEAQRIMHTQMAVKNADGEWKLYNLVADMEYKNAEMICNFHPVVQEMLESKAGFTHLAYDEMALCSAYPAMRLYEVCQRWQDKGLAYYSVDEWRNLLGATAKSYDVMAQFKRRILAPAVDEVNKTTCLTVTPEYIRAGRKTTHIKMHIKAKPQTTPTAQQGQAQPAPTLNELEDAGQQRLFEEQTPISELTPTEQEVANRMHLNYNIPQDKAEGYVQAYGVTYCQEQMEYTRKAKQAGTARNVGGYLKTAIEQDYAGSKLAQERAKAQEEADRQNKAVWDKIAKAQMAGDYEPPKMSDEAAERGRAKMAELMARLGQK